MRGMVRGVFLHAARRRLASPTALALALDRIFSLESRSPTRAVRDGLACWVRP